MSSDDNNERQLVDTCVQVMDTYDPDLQSVEDHINYYIEHCVNLDEDDQTFIMEVFSGCIRYNQLLTVVTNGFYIKDGKNVLRSEENLYKVISYLALFRLDELGMGQFRKFIRAQDPIKMHKFLQFFSNEKNIRTWMKDEWNKIYDSSYVQTSILSPLLANQPEIQEVISQLKDKLDNKTKPKKPAVKNTETKPFNITQPQPRSVPMPEAIPKLQKHKPAPKTTYTLPKEQTFIQKVKEDNRRKAEEQLMESNKLQFTCANPEKSEKTRKRLQNIILEEDGKLDFDRHKSHPVPSSVLRDNIPIRLNAAAILREGKLYRKREEEELKKLEMLEAGARDPSDFLDWQNKMRQQDLEAQMADIERRKLEGKLSHEEAILAKQNLILDNKEKVSEMKEEAQELMNQYLKRRLKEEKQMRQLVETVMEGHENAKDAQRKLREYKASVVAEVSKESQELMKRALEDAEEEMKQKMELILEIRAMESKPVIREKLVDKTKTAGYGFLNEMSIAELNERLALAKLTRLEEQEEKRDSILSAKEAKDQMLINTLETISRHRQETNKAASLKLETKKKTRNQKDPIKDEKLMELQRKLEEKRQERKSAQEKLKIKPNKQSAMRTMQLVDSKKAGEQGRWQELERTKERTAKLESLGIGSSQAATRLLNQADSLAMY